MMNIIKTDRKTSMHTSTLSDLLEIQVEGPPLATFSPDRAVKLWWKTAKQQGELTKLLEKTSTDRGP